MSKIAILGAGIAGLTAAYDLLETGNHVSIYEANAAVGGLAGGFKKANWNWSVEKFYHHWFQTDKAMLDLIKKLGWQDQILFFRPKTVVYYQDKFYPLDSPLAVLLFPGFSLLEKLRFSLVTFYLRYIASWHPLEKYTSKDWLHRYYGAHLYKMLFEPLLIGKFSHNYQEVPMSWFWARFKARSSKLGTFEGGFQNFLDKFADEIQKNGANFIFNCTARKIEPQANGRLKVITDKGKEVFDKVLVTTSPKLLAKLVPSLDNNYKQKLLSLKSIGAVVVIFALSHKLSKDGFYWFNLPKAAGFPFLALVEHTNFISTDKFGGEHILYCGDYLPSDHEYFQLTKEELIKRFLPSLKRINSGFHKSWIIDSWLFRLPYAQPIPTLNHSKNIPDIKTPIPNLYFVSMSQVYPWDRGTNYAVELANRAAHLISG
jgi:protoporphyrinogen oxidase